MILDALNTIYVWIGMNANPNEKKHALRTAQVCLLFPFIKILSLN